MSHYTTILQQLLQILPRYRFECCVKEAGADRYVKTFTCWNQLTALLYGHATGKDSLRDIETGIASHTATLYHVGMAPVKRSTLADANRKRPWKIFEHLFSTLLEHCQRYAPRHPFKFKNKLYSIDATTIMLCWSLFPWAKYSARKGAVKIHTMLNHAKRVVNHAKRVVNQMGVFPVPRS